MSSRVCALAAKFHAVQVRAARVHVRRDADLVQIDSITKAVPSYGELPCPLCCHLRRGIDHRDNCPECGERGFEGMFVMRGRDTISAGVEWRAL